MQFHIEQVINKKTVFEEAIECEDRNSLQEAQNMAITNWIEMQGKYAQNIYWR